MILFASMTFAFLLGGFLITKFWQDTLMLSISVMSPYIGLVTKIISKSVIFSSIGLTAGAMIVGPLNDRFGPKRTFPLYLIFTSLFNILLLFNMNVNVLRALLLLRSVCIAGSINNTYVGTSLLYKGDKLPRMTSILYMVFFGFSALFPIIFAQVVTIFSFQALTIGSAVFSIITAYYLYKNLPTKEPIQINFATFKTWKNFLSDSRFLAMSSVSMICIGGFYGFIAVYAYQFAQIVSAGVKYKLLVEFSITLALIQGIGRLCTFLTTSMCSVRLSLANIGQYLSISMMGISIGMLWMFISAVVFNKLILFGMFGFFLTCLASGIAQPATKLGLLTIFKNSAGSGQSLVGTGNSVYEVIAMMFVFNIPCQPLGGYLYLLLTAIITFILAIYFRNMKQI